MSGGMMGGGMSSAQMSMGSSHSMSSSSSSGGGGMGGGMGGSTMMSGGSVGGGSIGVGGGQSVAFARKVSLTLIYMGSMTFKISSNAPLLNPYRHGLKNIQNTIWGGGCLVVCICKVS